MSDPKANAVLVDALGSALQRGGHALGSVPDLLKRVLAEESWREFVTQRGEPVHPKDLDEFVTTPPLQGLGASVELVERVIADDGEAVAMFREARKGTNNISTKSRTTRHGTRRDYALERLQRDVPELHAEVLAGNLTAHGAMVKAGFRLRTITVPPDAQRAARTLRKHLSAEQCAELARLLTEDN